MDPLREFRLAARSLFRSPVVSIAVILTLGLGIGANAAIFGAVRALLLEPLPYGRPDSLVMIWSRWVSFEKTWLSDAEVLDYRSLKAFRSVAAWATQQGNLGGEGEPVRIGVGQVTANVFDVLGVEPLLGRVFTSDEESAASQAFSTEGGLTRNADVAVLSHGLWQRRYGADSSVIGRTIELNGRPRLVVGVMPRDFQLPTDFNADAAEPTQVWVPLRLDPSNRGSHSYYSAARLSPGVTVDQANSEIRSLIQARISEGLYHREMRFEAFAVPVDQDILGSVRPAVLLLWASAAFLLLIACANVTNLLLARSEARQRDMAVLSAIGASPGRLARGPLCEGLLLSGFGTVLGMILASAMIRLLTYADPTSIPRVATVRIDVWVFAFAALLMIVATVLLSLVPVWRLTRVDLTDAMKEGGSHTTGGVGKQRLRSMLATAQLATAVVLLIGAGLALRSLWALERIPLGFDPANVLTLRVTLPAASYGTPERVMGFFDGLLEEVRRLPGVQHAGLLRSLPLADEIGDWGIDVEGFVEEPGRNAKGDWQIASAGAVEAMGERLIRGRTLTNADNASSAQVALINEAMATAYWPGADPVGQRFRMGDMNRPWITVVGVIGDVKHNDIRGGVKEKFYRPHTQFHLSSGFPFRSMILVVRAERSPMTLAAPIREIVRSFDRNLPVANVRTMEAVVDDSLATSRFSGVLLGVFASIAVLLAALGVYSVLTYLANRRSHELGIRIAMGARRAEILRLVAAQGVRIAALGLTIGLVAAVMGVRFMGALLYQVEPTDPATFVGVSIFLGLVALAASVVPAGRASRLDPLRVLKTE